MHLSLIWDMAPSWNPPISGPAPSVSPLCLSKHREPSKLSGGDLPELLPGRLRAAAAERLSAASGGQADPSWVGPPIDLKPV